MRLVVLDASVAIKWYIRENDSDAAQKLLDSDVMFFAPDLFLAEVVGALIRQHREYRQLTKDDVRLAIEDVLRVGIEMVPSRVLLPRAAEIAIELGHPVRDCFYLALAERWDTVMITADVQFLAKAGRSEWAKHITSLTNVGEII